MSTMDPRDQALLAACPVIAAPRFGALPDMGNGQRIIVARNGWFVQTRLDWLDSIVALGHGSPSMRLPYGEVAEHLCFSFGVLPIRLIEAFVAAGREHLPNEAAGVLIYSRRTGQLRLAMCEPEQTSPVHIHYRRPAMADDETVAVDLHTHGRAPAFWSGADDRDDQGIKVAGVFGLLDRPRPSACFRLVINGLYQPLDRHPWRESQGEWPEQGAAAQRSEGWMRRVLWRWRERHLPG
ncbi:MULTISPECIES: PRTRC system protein A [Comamonadaceae]|uniref:PRTRC system protein A n=1 Tax=Alicycliphilus denitrificans (strain DSM 14773 / CIP 107495 / K601) TaxID=596154 RepID=F4G940_ALIDK|nr:MULTISPECIES: PRTRC system protein A [Comamonadaceae]AEB85630.1 PRTRC system protein A [Alicycliphilus denitrificans K601]